MSASSKRPLPVTVLILLLLLEGLGALFGGAALMLAPDGSLLGMPLSVMQGAPFADFFIPGLLLFTFVGLFPVCIAWALWKRPACAWPNAINPLRRMHWSWSGALAAGLGVIIWILVELLWVPFTFIHAVYLSWGALILLFSLLPAVRRAYRLQA